MCIRDRLLAGLMVYGSSYFNQIAITTMIFVILAASLNLITGSAGLLSLGHAAFFGVGAYAAALLSTKLGWPFWLTLPAAGAIAAAVGALVAIPTMRLTSIYFAVATLGIGEMIYVTLLNWVGLTRGPVSYTHLVPFFGPIAGPPGLRRPHQPLVFPVRAEHREEFRALIAHGKSLGLQRVALFHADTAVGREHLGNVERLAGEAKMDFGGCWPFKSDITYLLHPS